MPGLKTSGVKAYWWTSRPNFGDALAPLLLSRFAEVEPQWATVSKASVVTVGSILEHVPPLWEGFILGTGRMWPDSRLHLYGEETTILGFRGPLTAKGWRADCAIGDPGLLADELVPSPSKEYDLGLVPHWSDRSLTKRKEFWNDKWSTTVINPADDPLDVVSKIGRCRKIVSSSLHGLIVADGFGIPRRFEYTSQFDYEGHTFKFEDYSASIGTKLEPGVTRSANRNRVEDRKHELWDAYRMLGKLLRAT